MKFHIHRSALDWTIFLFLTVVILWKGGKALDAVWLLAFVAVFITLADILLVPKKERDPVPMIPWFLALLFLFSTILSFLFSSTKNVGFDEVLQTASLILLFRYALAIPANRVAHVQSRLARCIAAAALVACGIGMSVYVFQPVSRFVGTFFDYRFSTDYWPNAWAEFLLLAWPMLMWSVWCRKRSPSTRRGEGMGRGLVTGLLLSCLLLSYSRGALVVFGLQCGLMTIVLFIHHRKSVYSKRLMTSTLLVSVLSIVFFLGANRLRSQFHPVQSVLEKVTFTASEGSSSISERQQFWSQAITLAKEKPLFGWGPYSFRFLQPHLQQDVLATSDHPHNVFLKLAMERGVGAALLFALIVMWSLGSVIRMEKGKWKKENDSVLRPLLILGVLGVLVHNLIDYNLQFVGLAAPMWLALGTLAPRGRGRSVFLSNCTPVFIAILLLVCTVTEGRFLYFSSRARAAERVGNFPEALRLYSETDLSMFQRDAWLSRSRILMTSGTLEAAHAAIDHAIALNPQDFRVWKLQGDLFIQTHQIEAAKQAFQQAYDFGRFNDLGITRVLVELWMKDRDFLDVHRHEYEVLLDDVGLAIQQNTHFIDLSSNVEELAKLCDLLARAYPLEAEEYQALKERSLAHALLERSRLSGRPRGLLW